MFHVENNENRNEKVLQRGCMEKEIACCAYFYNGEITPLFFKMQDDTGEIQTYHIKHIKYGEYKKYKGQRIIDFICRIKANGIAITVNIVHYIDSCKWSIVLKT